MFQGGPGSVHRLGVVGGEARRQVHPTDHQHPGRSLTAPSERGRGAAGAITPAATLVNSTSLPSQPRACVKSYPK